MFANIGGSSLCSIDVGGSFGRDLSAQGEKAMVAFAVEWLTKLFGSEVAAAVKKSSATRWNAAPFALGAMSAASPGGQASRKVLTEPIGCMYLAGEATHETLWGTVDGAWESGERAAEAALRRIGALKDPTGRAAGEAAARAPSVADLTRWQRRIVRVGKRAAPMLRTGAHRVGTPRSPTSYDRRVSAARHPAPAGR